MLYLLNEPCSIFLTVVLLYISIYFQFILSGIIRLEFLMKTSAIVTMYRLTMICVRPATVCVRNTISQTFVCLCSCLAVSYKLTEYLGNFRNISFLVFACSNAYCAIKFDHSHRMLKEMHFIKHTLMYRKQENAFKRKTLKYS